MEGVVYIFSLVSKPSSVRVNSGCYAWTAVGFIPLPVAAIERYCNLEAYFNYIYIFFFNYIYMYVYINVHTYITHTYVYYRKEYYFKKS